MTELARNLAQRLAEARLREAQTLLEQGNYSGAYYLAGYTIELSLKSILAKQFAAETIPDKKLVDKIYNHDLKGLLELAGLKNEFDKAIKTDVRLSENWEIVTNWNVNSRYVEILEHSARDLLGAIAEPESGIFPWIRMHW